VTVCAAESHQANSSKSSSTRRCRSARRATSKGCTPRARRGEIAEFTGISAPYEPALAPEIRLRTDAIGIDACVDRLLAHVAGTTAAEARAAGTGAGRYK
jgi:adenylylsulfate kinase-like enzyme